MLNRETFDPAEPDALRPRLNKIEMDENLSVLKPDHSVGHASRTGYSNILATGRWLMFRSFVDDKRIVIRDKQLSLHGHFSPALRLAVFSIVDLHNICLPGVILRVVHA